MSRLLLGLGSLFAAWVLQFGVAPHLSLLGARPDFLIVATVCFALISPPGSAAAFGFGSALVQGGMAGANLTHYVTSRCVTAFLVSLGRTTDLEFSVVVAAIVAFIASLVAQGLLYFFAPTPNIRDFAQATILMASMNAVFAMPAYATMRRLGKPKKV